MDEPSRTAILAAATRGMHAELVDDPLIDGSHVAELYTEEEIERITELGLKTSLSEDQRRELGDEFSLQNAWELAFRHGAFAAAAVVRNRYAEDCLETAVHERGIDQYVNVGAGLDTFPFRRPELAEELTIFELDHPATQGFKRDRLAAAGLTPPPSLHFVPVDLEVTPVADALADTGLDRQRPAFCSWLGVSIYLPSDAIFGTLGSLAEVCADGSELVFDFIDTEGSNPDTTTPAIRRFMQFVGAMGEPVQDGLDLNTLNEDFRRLGLELEERLDSNAQVDRYFADQPDFFGPTEHYHFARGTVAETGGGRR